MGGTCKGGATESAFATTRARIGNSFRECLNVDWTMVNDLDTTHKMEDTVDALTTKIASAADRSVPYRTIDLERSNQLSDEIKNLIRQRNALRKRFQATRNTDYKKEANRITARIRKEIRAHKIKTFAQKLTGINVKDGYIWRLTRKSRAVIPPLERQNGKVGVTPAEISEEIASDFEAFHLTPETSPQQEDLVKRTVSSFLTNNAVNPSESIPFLTNPSKIRKLIKQSPSMMAPGPLVPPLRIPRPSFNSQLSIENPTRSILNEVPIVSDIPDIEALDSLVTAVGKTIRNAAEKTIPMKTFLPPTTWHPL
ncbi:hypothetical protein Trydic_g23159 [Trypoxylus dichotomus]